MGEFRVSDLFIGRPDSGGRLVLDIPTKVDGTYAVYRTDLGVMIQFADSDKLGAGGNPLGAEQRKSLASIYVSRGRINSYLDDLKASRDPRLLAQATTYETRLAVALALGLQGQGEQCFIEIENLKSELQAEKFSTARLMYLLTACAVVVTVISAIVIANSQLFRPTEAIFRPLWQAAAVGTVGAFVSIAIAIRNRTIKADRIRRNNVVDAALRIIIGALAAIVIMALIQTSAFGLVIGGVNVVGTHVFETTTGPLLVLLVGFVAGFSERLLPELLGKITTSVGSDQEMARRMPSNDAAKNEKDPTGNALKAAPAAVSESAASAPETPEADNDEDTCVDHVHDDDGDITHDVELPEAQGGVETRVA